MLIQLLVFTFLVPFQPRIPVAAAEGQPVLLETSPGPGLEDPGTTLAAIRQRGEAGDLEAQARLGTMYYLGTGAPMDWGQAQFWLRKAAERGHAEAQTKLAAMCFLGQGMAVDLDQSVGWFRKAAGQGEPHAQACLGVMLATGVGMPKDLVSSYAWLLQAVAGGDRDAVAPCLGVRRQLTPNQIEEGNRRAREAVKRRGVTQS